MKTINIKLTDEQHCLLTRISEGDSRKVLDLIYLGLADGLGGFYCERPLTIKKITSDYTDEEKKQITKNKKLEKQKGWDDLDWAEKKEKGFEHVSDYMSNYGKEGDFMVDFCKSLESNVMKSPHLEEVQA
tara:strand:- start:730 stop:1119 length:390 start_codon:yes stop_codon:yes gene_type:complete